MSKTLERPKYPDYTGREPCRSTDPEAFYCEYHSPSLKKSLAKICGGCEIQAECAEYAIWSESVGYWGGLSAPQRRKIRRERGIILNDELRQSAVWKG